MILEEEDCFNNQYYVSIRRLLTITGLWPHLKSSKRLSRIFLITIAMLIAICFHVYLILTAERKAEPIIQVLQTFLPTFLFACAYWNLVYNFTIIQETLEHVQNDWSQLTCEDELRIMHGYAARSTVYSQAMSWAVCFYVVFLISPSLLRLCLYTSGIAQQTKFILPVHSDVFVTTTSLYIIMLLCQLIMIAIGYVIGITNYTMFITLLQHACALFIIVTNKIDRPFIKNEYKFFWTKTVSKTEAELEWIISVIENYHNAIKFVELLKLLYEKIFIIEVLLAFSVIITDFIYLFQFLDLMISTGEALKICFYIAGTTLIIYGYDYLGQELIEHSISVYVKCRLIPFYALSVRTNKLLLQLITRSMKPCNISIAGIVVASHELFAKVTQASFSFATVYYNVH